MAAKRRHFGLTISKLIFLGQICLICGTESTIFTDEAGNKESDRVPTLSTTGAHGSASVEDLLTGRAYVANADVHTNAATDSLEESTKNLNELDATISKSNTDEYDNPSSIDSISENTVNSSDENSDNVVDLKSDNENLANLTDSKTGNISESAGNSTNKTVEPVWSCMKYNITQQNVIILKDKNSLIWWLDELNKTMGCAVVLFYAKWCYFSASLAPMYNAVGRAFPDIPILAIDAYTHNSLNTRYGIVGVPTIILFQESTPVARFNRSRTFKDLVEFIHQSTGMVYNTSVEVSQIDYDEGPLPSTPSQDFNFHLFASLCFLICFGLFVLWRLQYVQVFVEYVTSLRVVRTVLGTAEAEREKID